MILPELPLYGIETTINALLDRDEEAVVALQKLHGSCIAIALLGTGIVFYFVPDQRGHLQLFGHWEGEPDCTISSSPLDLMRASDKTQSSAQLFAGHIKMTGDTGLGHQFSRILADLSIDWEEQLAKLVGDTLAHIVGRNARRLYQQNQQRRHTFRQNLAEYLTEEARLLPHHYQMAAWSRDVATTRDDVERLMARVERLQNLPDA